MTKKKKTADKPDEGKAQHKLVLKRRALADLTESELETLAVGATLNPDPADPLGYP